MGAMLLKGSQHHLHPTKTARRQVAGELQHLLAAAGKGSCRQRHQQQRLLRLSPVALQQPQFTEQGIGQLFGVIGQIEGALLQHGRQKGRQPPTTAVEPRDRQGGQPPLSRTAQPQSRAGPHSRGGFRQAMG